MFARLQGFAMRSAKNVHPEFGLWFNLRREAGCTVAFIICGSIAAASGLVLQIAGHEANVDGRSVIAAVPPQPQHYTLHYRVAGFVRYERAE
jgi:hypothetical protein